MFDIGFSELLIVALVGLVVLGPKRLPEVARTVGHWVAKVRRFVTDVKQDIDREMQQAELSELRNLKQDLDETRRVVEQTSGNLIKEANIAPAAESTGNSSGTPASSVSTEPSPQPPSAPAPRKKRTTKPGKKTTSKPSHGRAR